MPFGLVAAAAGSYVLAIALSWHGPNQWPYAWLDGVRRPEFPPAIKRVLLDSPLLWLLVLAVVVVALTVPTRMVGTRDPRLNVLRAVPILAVIALVGTSVYTVFTFGLAAVQGVPRSSLWAQSLADPTASRCAAAAGTEVLDPFTAVPLTEAPGLPAPPPATGFVNNGGFYAGNRPQGVAGDRVWGSLVARDGASADSTQGRLTTSWYGLPDRSAGTVTVIAAGSLSDGVGLTAEYGRRSGDAVEPAGTEDLTDAAHDPSWRTLTLEPPAGADLVRLVGVDESGTINGWLALSAPVVARPEPLADFLPRPAPVALGWPLAFALALPASARDRQRDHRARGVRRAVGREGRAVGLLGRRVAGLAGRRVRAGPALAVGAGAGHRGAGRPGRAGGRVRQRPRPRPLHADRGQAHRGRCVDGDGATHRAAEPPPYGRSVLSPPRSALRHADPGTRGDSRRARLVLAARPADGARRASRSRSPRCASPRSPTPGRPRTAPPSPCRSCRTSRCSSRRPSAAPRPGPPASCSRRSRRGRTRRRCRSTGLALVGTPAGCRSRVRAWTWAPWRCHRATARSRSARTPPPRSSPSTAPPC